MSINIRQGIFETNSSSTHTLVFHKTDPTLIVDDTPMEIHGGSYGRCPDYPLKTTEERLNYLWQAIWDFCVERFDYDKQEYYTDKDKLNTWKNAIHLYCPNAILYDINPHDWNGIDHCYELENLLKAMERDIFLLKYFLLDPDGYIIIDGDESNDDERSQYFDPTTIPYVGWEDQDTLIELNNNTFVYEKGN